ncbi:fatty acid desaturase, putative [Bodo saltans]|uniref:Fatty acid desaturase, putative n=1 Tax=Bodo saltans TaxID=75058 RepID=A0A0S4IVK0_BODSA|nr:fatty acid desaturase, putative [Bodo saltans]|eukprot:CUG02306.1 fatty acid desaturase, putative [Bodo saltans]
MAPVKTSAASAKKADRQYVDKASPVGTEGASKLQWLRSGRSKEFEVLVPPATLTMRDIQSQIPKHFFNRSIGWSSFYVARDLVQVAVTMYVMMYFGEPAIAAVDSLVAGMSLGAAVTSVAYWLTRAIVWNAFWFVQGLNGTGIWVMAHECGHQAFSPWRSVNDAVGLVLHSAVLVPYHSWRITHGNHHKHTSHLTKDTVFIPSKEESILKEIIEESPIVSLFWMVITFTIGWPGYILWNAAGQDYGRFATHFDPRSPQFRSDEYNDVIISDLGIFAVLAAIGAAIYNFGFLTVWCYYLAPYMWVNFWLVFITYLQHTDIRLPHYTADEWNFVRGALCTIDRDFGAPLNWWLHHINDSHVVHHIFSQMPFYNAIQVTRTVLPDIIGEMHQTSKRTLWSSLWESWVECRYVVPKDGVAVYHK